MTADAVVVLASSAEPGRGLFVELGAALARAELGGLEHVVVVGEIVHESVFHFHPRVRRVLYDYSNRSGFPRPVEDMRGIATKPSMSMAPGMQPSPRVEDSRSAVASAVAGAAS